MKTILEVRDQHGIRELLQRELLNKYDIRVPKITRKKQNYSKDGAQVFGNALYNLPSDFIQDCGYVPRFLVEAATSVDEHIESEGIFRKAGSVNRQKDLRQILEHRGSLRSAKILSIDDIANLIKQFLRELPEPLIVPAFQDVFIRCLELRNSESQIEAVMMLCILLPFYNLCTLKFIISLLARVVDNSTKNKMDTVNLAKVMTPNLMSTSAGKQKNEKVNAGEEKNLMVQTAFVEMLINNAEMISLIPEYLTERVELLESLNSDDEHFDITDELRPKKKKRRSGSLQGLVSGIKNTFTKMRTSSSSINSSKSEQSLSDQPSQLSTVSSVTDATPVVVRKRKALDDMAFSTKKKNAILKNLPQGRLMGQSYLPAHAAKVGRDVPDITLSPSCNINFCGESPVRFSATPTQEKLTPSKRKRMPSPFRKARRNSSGKMGCFSPKTPKTKRSFFRRVSGSAPSSPASQDSLNTSAKKRMRLFKRHKKVPSSPARLLNGQKLLGRNENTSRPVSAIEKSTNDKVCIVDDVDLNDPYYLASRLKFDLITPHGHTSKNGCHSVDVNKSDILKSRAPEAEEHFNASLKLPHKRAFSADASICKNLRRGQPNTPKNGLPQVTPNKYQRAPIPCDLRSPSSESTDSSKSETDSSDTVVGSQVSCSSSDGASAVKVVDCVISSGSNDSDDVSNNEEQTVVAEVSSSEIVQESDLPDASDFINPEKPEKVLKESTSSSSVDSAVSTMSCESTQSTCSMVSVKSADSLDSGHEGSVDESSQEDTKTKKSKKEQKPRLKSRAKDLLEKVESFRSRKATDQFRKKAAVIRRPSLKEPKLHICSETRKLLSNAGVVENLPTPADNTDSIEVLVVHPTSPIAAAAACTPGKMLKDITKDDSDPTKAIHGSVLDLQAAGKVKKNLEKFSHLYDEQKEILVRHSSPLRFAQSKMKKRGLSPVRIPTIFAKNDKQAALFREKARRAVKNAQKAKENTENEAPLPTTPGSVASPFNNPRRSRAKASLPISNNMAKMISDSAKQKFSVVQTPESVVLEKKDTENSDSLESKTPRRTDSRKRSMEDLAKLIKPVQLNKVLSNAEKDCGADSGSSAKPLQNSSNAQNANVAKRTMPSLPKIKQAPLSTQDITSALLKKKVSLNTPQSQLKKLSLQETPRKCRSPMKPVKRLGSPSPKKSPKHYPGSPIRPLRVHPHRSNGKSPIPTHLLNDLNVY